MRGLKSNILFFKYVAVLSDCFVVYELI